MRCLGEVPCTTHTAARLARSRALPAVTTSRHHSSSRCALAHRRASQRRPATTHALVAPSLRRPRRGDHDGESSLAATLRASRTAGPGFESRSQRRPPLLARSASYGGARERGAGGWIRSARLLARQLGSSQAPREG